MSRVHEIWCRARRQGCKGAVYLQMLKMLGDAALWQAVLRNCMQADTTSECLKPDPIGYDKP